MSIHRRWGLNRATTKIEVLVVLILIGVLIMILFQGRDLTKERSRRLRCASNLRQIGQALQLYNADYKSLPRGRYNPQKPATNGFSGANAKDLSGVDENDPTIAFFLLVKHYDLSPDVFVCDSTSQSALSSNKAKSMSNFPSPDNLSYSIANPYPSQEAVSKGYQWVFNTSPDFALASDRNDAGSANVTAAIPTASIATQKKANSKNHDQEGMNILYADGHVDWSPTIYCGVERDPIFCANTRPTLSNGLISVTLQPDTTDPQWEFDSVMLPNKW